jgi:hypothetical protein
LFPPPPQFIFIFVLTKEILEYIKYHIQYKEEGEGKRLVIKKVPIEEAQFKFSVLGIRGILMRIRIPGSLPLTNGSGSGSGSGSKYFLQ